MKKLVLILAFFSTLFGVSCQPNETVTVLNPEQYKDAIMKEEIQLVDVRTPEEYQAGYIKDAVNIDFYEQEKFREAFEEFDKNKPIYLYCRSGGRSHKAANMLVEMGFKEIYDLEGGYLNWQP